jgi:Rrf2 family protein
MVAHPEGPKGLPIVGTLGELAKDALAFVTGMSRTYGDVVPFRVGRRRAWLITHPDGIEEVFVRHKDSVTKDIVTHELSAVLGQGLLTSEGAHWKTQRRRIAPSFTPKHLSAYGEAMVQSTLEGMPALSDDVDVHKDFTRITLHIVLRTIFGIEPEGEAQRVGDMLEALMEAFEVENRTMWRVIPEWVPAKHRRRVDGLKAELDAMIFGLVAKARQEGTEGRVDLLARLLAAQDDDGTRMDDQQLRDELLTLFLAGHETTALSLSYALWLLAEHPEVQDTVVAELTSVLGDREATLADLRQLPVLDGVVKESLRLYPPAWAAGREAAQDIVVGGVYIPKGDQITVSPWVTHRDTRWWIGATRFRPQRWHNGETDDLPRFAYFPFGGGPRVCVGQHFATMELALVLATVLRHPCQATSPSWRRRSPCARGTACTCRCRRDRRDSRRCIWAACPSPVGLHIKVDYPVHIGYPLARGHPMKLTTTEEYGLRCLLQVARLAPHTSESLVSIRDVAEAEGLSPDYVAKLLGMLRKADLVDSTRGATGGYCLSRPPESITAFEALAAFDAPLFGQGFCQGHSGKQDSCVHSSNTCSLTSLWRAVDTALHQVLSHVTVRDLLTDTAPVPQANDATRAQAAPALGGPHG